MSRMQFSEYETIQSFICGKYLMEIWNLSKIVHVDLEVSYTHVHFKRMQNFTILTYMNIDIILLFKRIMFIKVFYNHYLLAPSQSILS